MVRASGRRGCDAYKNENMDPNKKKKAEIEVYAEEQEVQEQE